MISKNVNNYENVVIRKEQEIGINNFGLEYLVSLEQEIERLKQGYCELKEKCNKGECDCTHEEYNGMCEENIKRDLEIERLNNIINEFEDWLNAKYEEMHDIWYVKVLIKLQELKGDVKEWK